MCVFPRGKKVIMHYTASLCSEHLTLLMTYVARRNLKTRIVRVPPEIKEVWFIEVIVSATVD